MILVMPDDNATVLAPRIPCESHAAPLLAMECTPKTKATEKSCAKEASAGLE